MAAEPEWAASPGRAGQAGRLPPLASLSPWPSAAPSEWPRATRVPFSAGARGGDGPPSLPRPRGPCPSLPASAGGSSRPLLLPGCRRPPRGGRGAAAGRTSRAGTGAQPPGCQGEGWGHQGAKEEATRRRHRVRAAPGSPAGGGAAVWRREGPRRTPERRAERSGAEVSPSCSIPAPPLTWPLLPVGGRCVCALPPRTLAAPARCMQSPERRSPGGYAGCVGIYYFLYYCYYF